VIENFALLRWQCFDFGFVVGCDFVEQLFQCVTHFSDVRLANNAIEHQHQTGIAASEIFQRTQTAGVGLKLCLEIGNAIHLGSAA
jgi:hypothetical protein